MLVVENAYDNGNKHELSFMQMKPSASKYNADVLIYDAYQFLTDGYIKRQSVITNFLNKKIYIDGTYELMSEPVLNFLNEAFKSLKNFYYFFIPSNQTETSDILKKCLQKGLVIQSSQYFADYPSRYRPIYNKEIEKRKFLFYTGKPSKERTLLVSLLSYYNLLDNGYVSYFGENYVDNNFDNQKSNDIFESRVPLLLDEKNKVKKGLDKLEIPLTLDVNVFGKETAHAKNFNGDYYKAVDFCIISESDHENGFFITEKTVKCINLNKKFIAFSAPNYIENLKAYYKDKLNTDISHLTDWCNTSYSKEQNTFKRAEKIIQIVKEETKE